MGKAVQSLHPTFQVTMKGGEKMTQITIRLSYQEKNILAKYAFENDLTVSQIVRSLIRKYLKEIENEESMD